MYSDEMMVFDEAKKRYILTDQCALAQNINLDQELNSAGVTAKNNLPDQILDRVSKTVYNYVYAHGGRDVKQRKMAEDDSYRPFIQDAMIEQLLYFMTNGDLNQLARVDVQSGREHSRAAKLDAAYAPEMQNILGQTDLLYCGFQ